MSISVTKKGNQVAYASAFTLDELGDYITDWLAKNPNAVTKGIMITRSDAGFVASLEYQEVET